MRSVSFRWELFLETLTHLYWRWLTAAICLILLSYVGRALRWQAMLRPLGRPIGLWRLTSDTIIGATAGLFLGRVGEVVRPYLISVQTGLPVSSQAAAWLLERVLDLMALILVCGYALMQIRPESMRIGRTVRNALTAGGYSLFLTGALCVILLFAFRNPNGAARRRILDALTFLPEHQQHRASRLLTAFSDGLACTRDSASLLILLGYTVLEWTVIVMGSYSMLHAFPATHGFDLLRVLVVMAFMTLGNVIQLPGIGGGVQAGCIVALTQLYRVPLEQASGVALLIWFVGSFCILPLGILGAFHEGLNWRKLKLLSAKQILEGPDA
jgi:uncharacterized protein (TIRG00374 family)